MKPASKEISAAVRAAKALIGEHTEALVSVRRDGQAVVYVYDRDYGTVAAHKLCDKEDGTVMELEPYHAFGRERGEP